MGQREIKDIKIRCYHFSLSVIQLINTLEVKRIFYSLIDQFLRSSTSIGANVVEAKSAHSKKDFIKFYEISLKSANETKYWICLLRDGLKIDKEKMNEILNEADEISKIIATIIIKIKSAKADTVKEKFISYSSDSDDLILLLNQNSELKYAK